MFHNIVLGRAYIHVCQHCFRSCSFNWTSDYLDLLTYTRFSRVYLYSTTVWNDLKLLRLKYWFRNHTIVFVYMYMYMFVFTRDNAFVYAMLFYRVHACWYIYLHACSTQCRNMPACMCHHAQRISLLKSFCSAICFRRL